MSLSKDDTIKYKNLYLQTAWGYLNQLRKNVSFLISGQQVENAIKAAHIAAHSLKSQSVLMGYNQIGQFSKQMEEIFNNYIESTKSIDKLTLEIILIGLNKVQSSLVQISENGNEVDISEEIRKLEGI